MERRKSNGLGSGFVMVSSVLLRILASSMCTFITHTCEFDWFSLLFSTQLPSPEWLKLIMLTGEMLITRKTDQILPHNLAGQQQVKMDIFVCTVT